jgi:hypothetical protein
MFVEEAGDVVAAEVEHLDACVYVPIATGERFVVFQLGPALLHPPSKEMQRRPGVSCLVVVCECCQRKIASTHASLNARFLLLQRRARADVDAG